MNVKKFIARNNLSYDDIVLAVNPQFPKFRRSTVSMVANDDYGVTLSAGAVKALGEKYPVKKPNRKKGHQLTVRVDDEQYDLMCRLCEDYEMTMQDVITYCLEFAFQLKTQKQEEKHD